MSSKIDNAKRNRILFDFDSIVDLKISYIKKYYMDRNKPFTDEILKELKFNRMYGSEDILSSYEVLGKDYTYPSHPIFTSMERLIRRYLIYNGGIVPVALCADNFQKDIITGMIKGLKILTSPRDKVNTSRFSRIVVGDVKHIAEFRDPVMTDFMILNFRENFNKDNMGIIDISTLLDIEYSANSITVAKAYPEIENPEG